MLTDDEIRAIEERVKAASPGPWTAVFNKSMRSAWAIVRAGTSQTVLNLDGEKNVELDLQSHQVDADLDFIQHARDDMARLLEHCRALATQPASDSATDEESLRAMQSSLVEMGALLEGYRAALEFYGTYDNYRKPTPAPGEPSPLWVGNDLGKRARQLLGWPEPGAPATPTTDGGGGG